MVSTLLIEQDKYVFLKTIREKHSTYTEYLLDGHGLIVVVVFGLYTPERKEAAKFAIDHFISLGGVFRWVTNVKPENE